MDLKAALPLPASRARLLHRLILFVQKHIDCPPKVSSPPCAAVTAHFYLLFLTFDGAAHSTMGLRPHFDLKIQGFRIRFARNRLPMTDGWILQGGVFRGSAAGRSRTEINRHSIQSA
jgi:hypothetical protein